MARFLTFLLSFAFSISISTNAGTTIFSGPMGLIFHGKIAGASGNPIPGAEIRILDAGGKIKNHVLSNVEGLYRFPMILVSTAEAQAYKIEIKHLRFQPVRLDSALAGAAIGSPSLKNISAGQTPPLLELTRTVHRDFILTPAQDTSRLPAAARLDPFHAEYYYRQALLLLSERREQEAVPYLKIYAQIGGNAIEIDHSLKLIAAHDR
jgi:hypothetical protein